MEIVVLKSLVMRYGSKIGLKSSHKDCLWNLLDYDYNGKNVVWPGQESIKVRLGIKTRDGVRKITNDLCKRGLIKISSEKGKSHRYSFNGIAVALLPFYSEEIKKAQDNANKRKELESIEENEQVNHETPAFETRHDLPLKAGMENKAYLPLKAGMNSLSNSLNLSNSSMESLQPACAGTAPFQETANQPTDQKQEKPNAEPLPTETRIDCVSPAPTGGLRKNSERTEPGMAGPGVGEDFPSWLRYVMAYYGTRDWHEIEKHLKKADKGKDLTGEKVAAWCARCGTFQEWLNRNVDGTYFGKTNGRVHSNGFSGNGHSQKSGQFKRLESPAVESKRPAPPVTSADRTREFFFDKVIPLDIQVHGKQTLWYNPTEHPKVFAMAWQCYWPEEEILKRLPRYWRSTNDFYRKAGYNLRLFFQNFDEFADQLSKVEMRYPLLSDVHAAQEQADARSGV